MKSPSTTAALVLVLVVGQLLATGHYANAGDATQFVPFNKFDPSDRGSDWFTTDSLDLRGSWRIGIGIVGEYTHAPPLIHNPWFQTHDNGLEGAEGEQETAINRQLFMHLGASLVLFDTLRIGLNVPVSDGESNTFQKSGVSDVRLTVDGRLGGRYGDKVTAAIGGYLYMGDSARVVSGPKAWGGFRIIVAGEGRRLAYSSRLGITILGDACDLLDHEPLNVVGGSKEYPIIDGDVPDEHAYKTEFPFALAIGLKLFDGSMIVGPEIHGAVSFDREFAPPSLELLGGAHYKLAEWLRFGIGAGGALFRGPETRVVLSLEVFTNNPDDGNVTSSPEIRSKNSLLGMVERLAGGEYDYIITSPRYGRDENYLVGETAMLRDFEGRPSDYLSRNNAAEPWTFFSRPKCDASIKKTVRAKYRSRKTHLDKLHRVFETPSDATIDDIAFVQEILDSQCSIGFDTIHGTDVECEPCYAKYAYAVSLWWDERSDQLKTERAKNEKIAKRERSLAELPQMAFSCTKDYNTTLKKCEDLPGITKDERYRCIRECGLVAVRQVPALCHYDWGASSSRCETIQELTNAERQQCGYDCSRVAVGRVLAECPNDFGKSSARCDQIPGLTKSDRDKCKNECAKKLVTLVANACKNDYGKSISMCEMIPNLPDTGECKRQCANSARDEIVSRFERAKDACVVESVDNDRNAVAVEQCDFMSTNSELSALLGASAMVKQCKTDCSREVAARRAQEARERAAQRAAETRARESIARCMRNHDCCLQMCARRCTGALGGTNMICYLNCSKQCP